MGRLKNKSKYIFPNIVHLTSGTDLIGTGGLKLHNCFVYFIKTINPWIMVFYFFILLLRLLSY